MAKHNPIQVRNDAEEFAVVRKDLRFVLIMNGVFFLLLIGLFFLNRSSGKVDSFFSHLLKF